MTAPDITMTADRFRALVEAYGADPQRWPQSERRAAALYADRTPEARALLEEALALDTALAALPVPVPSSALAARLLADAAGTLVPGPVAEAPEPRPARGRLGALWDALWPSAPRWAPISLLAGAAALGMVTGVNLDAGVLTDATTVASADQSQVLLPDAQDLANLF